MYLNSKIKGSNISVLTKGGRHRVDHPKESYTSSLIRGRLTRDDHQSWCAIVSRINAGIRATKGIFERSDQ